MQVQKVLKHLVLEGSLDHGHIALLWDLTEKVSMPSGAGAVWRQNLKHLPCAQCCTLVSCCTIQKRLAYSVAFLLI